MNKTIISALVGALFFFSIGFAQGIKPRKSTPKPPTEATETASPAPATVGTTEPVSAGDVISVETKRLFYVGDGAGAARNIGMKVKVLRLNGDCEFDVVSPKTTFRSGDRIRFAVETNMDGFLYVVQGGTSGDSTLMFPIQDVNRGDNRIWRGAEMIVPGKGWYKFDRNRGQEDISFIFSKRKLSAIPKLIPAVDGATPVNPSAESVEGRVLAVVSGGTVKDLIFGDDQLPENSTQGTYANAAYVVNVNPASNDFCVLRLKLKHK